MDQVREIILWELTKHLCGCAKGEAIYVFDLEDNLKSLEGKWEDLLSMKQDLKRKVDEAEKTGEMQRTHEIDRWMKQVDNLQEEIKKIQVEGGKEIQDKCLSKCCPKNCASSYKLGKKVVKLLKNVDELAIKGQRFRKDVEIAHKLPPRLAVEMLPDETVGLDLMFDKVWSSIEAENVGVIGLYGMGGVGKTTLLKKVNNELANRRLDFDIVMWIVVSKKPDLDTIMDNIRKLVGIEDGIWNRCSNQGEKAAKIYQFLKQKRFVLLLDDIWARLELNMVGVPHPKESDFQSKVLFTTRSEDMCAKMQAQITFKVEILMNEEALELFCKKVGEETLTSHPDIPELAEEMAAECNGLPLALIVIGSAMAGVKSVEAWKHSKNNLMSSSWTISDLEKNVFSILKFSYDRLPDETHKNCFLYCALYPEDYEINVLDLIDKWIGEGFLSKDTTKSLRDIRRHGESVIEKLKLSCLLESVENDLFSSRTVKLHDVIRDMALWLALDQDENEKKKILVQDKACALSQNDVEILKIVKRISVINCGALHVPATACPNLSTLMFASTKYDQIIVGLANIQYMSRLKVLDLSCGYRTVIELPTEFGDLALLEYLNLKGKMWASKFPIGLKKLRNLKYFALHVNSGDLASIPLEVISSLEKLRVLRFTTNTKEISGEEREFLEKLESIRSLEELGIQLQTENGLNKLLESTKLQSCMWFLYLKDMGTPIHMPSLLASKMKMKHLHCIHFSGLNFVADSCVFDTCCLSKLRNVTISHCHSIIDLTWLNCCPLLQYLKINDCVSVAEVIKRGMEDDKGRENVDNIFSSLVELQLSSLPILKSIHKTALSFRSLRLIQIVRCPNLNKLPFDSCSAMDKLREIRGHQEWWDNLEWEDPAIKHKFQSKFKALQGSGFSIRGSISFM